jgi:hypothetical protein
MPKLMISSMTYPCDRLQEWTKGHCQLLTSSGASAYLKKILAKKVARRGGGRRFFGEAYVATKITHKEGFYGSFKWLTSARFSDDRPFPDGRTREFKEQLRKALTKHFTRRQLQALRERASAFKKETGVRPVPPDLWLVDRRGNHRFIEVKLERDRIRRPQLAGLALIASCLHAKTRISVEIVELHPDHKDHQRTFKRYNGILRRPA